MIITSNKLIFVSNAVNSFHVLNHHQFQFSLFISSVLRFINHNPIALFLLWSHHELNSPGVYSPLSIWCRRRIKMEIGCRKNSWTNYCHHSHHPINILNFYIPIHRSQIIPMISRYTFREVNTYMFSIRNIVLCLQKGMRIWH